MIITTTEKILTHTEYLAINGIERPTVFLWQEKEQAAALGISQKAENELNLQTIESDNVRIVRRQSGGGAVILSRDVLCFEVVAPLIDGFEGESIKDSFITYTQPLVNLLQKYDLAAGVSGISDVSISLDTQQRKIAGCAQLRKKKALVVHASILVSLDKSFLERYLGWPSAVPDYREGRSHSDFCITLQELLPEMTAEKLADQLTTEFESFGWDVVTELPKFAAEEADLFERKYGNPEWNINRKRV